jgi:lysozyme
MRDALGCASCTIVALLAGLTVACGDSGSGDAGDSREQFAQASSAVAVCADGETIPGIDVSYYQGTIDWNAVAADGIVFAVSRTNHGGFIDPKFEANWEGSKQAGLIRSAYQFFNAGDDPVAQAQTLIDMVGTLEPGDLPPVLDIETTDGQSAATIAANVGSWLDTVEGALGRKPIIYTGSYFWNDNVGSDAYVDHPLWIAHYTTNCPNLPTVWSDWAMWQYTSSGAVAGIAGNVDRNRFNGPVEALQDLAGNGYRASVVSLEYPDTLPAGAYGEVVLTLKNEGARAWTANTKLGTTEPRDRESPFAGPDWESATRALNVGDVPPGETVELHLQLLAPSDPGVYVESFNLVEESVAWFSDLPPGGGPSDDTIVLSITVEEGSSGSGSGGSDGGSSPVDPGAGGAHPNESVELKAALSGEVGCTSSGHARPSAWWPLALFAVGALARRRRAS